ncbi:hypothetical protein EDD86DRAFT_198600 [Gorgonomyces haynaldii]|nr:hypothetical protein EDD86DRAFT_198600 [Gorgonomyces haynaldii]
MLCHVILLYMRKYQVAKLLIPYLIVALLYDIFAIIWFYTPAPIVFRAIADFFGCLAALLFVLVDCEILKRFCRLGTLIDEKGIVKIQIAFVFEYLITTVGLNAEIFYIDTPMPSILVFWMTYVAVLHFALCYIYRFLQSIYVMKLTWGQFQDLKSVQQEIDGAATGKSDYRFFWIVYATEVICGIFFALFYFLGLQQLGGSPSIAVIGYAFGNTTAINSYLVLNKIRSIKFEQKLVDEMGGISINMDTLPAPDTSKK